MDLLRSLGRFFGWLSGVVVGVSAVLYVLGFVATTAHDALLGLEEVITARESLWYLRLGAKVAAHAALQATLALMLVLVLVEVLFWLGRRLHGISRGRPRFVERTVDLVASNYVWLLALASLVAASQMMGSFDGALLIDPPLLLGDFQHVCEQSGVVLDLIENDLASLSQRATRVVFFATVALGVAGYATPKLMEGRIASLPLLIFIGVAVQAAGSVPAAYGIFVMGAKLRSVVAEGLATNDRVQPDLYLVSLGTDGLWAWSVQSRDLHWLARSSYEGLKVGPSQSIASVVCS